jgi:hypothetical protein
MVLKSTIGRLAGVRLRPFLETDVHPCVNLRDRFGHRYRLSRDPAFDSWSDPWGHQIRCRRDVVIYPHGGDLLAVELNHHNGLARRLQALGLRCTQHGDHEKTFVFPISRFDEVAAIVQPRKKRQLTDEQKEALRNSMTNDQRAENLKRARAAR